MKIKPGFVIKEVGDRLIVIPTGEQLINFSGIITLNESGRQIFTLLQNEIELEEIIQELEKVYQIDYKTAKTDVVAFIDILKKHDLII